MKVKELRVYPIKSTAPLFIDDAFVTKTGLLYDRVFGIFNSEGQALTARDYPQLLTISCKIEQGQLIINQKDDFIGKVPLRPEKGQELNVKVHRYSASGFSVDKALDEWFSNFLGVDCSLLRFDPDCKRRVIKKHGGLKKDRVSFSDQAPLLMISEASLEDLNNRLDHPITMDRFRPNIIVEGCPPYSEDQWEFVTIGSQEFRVIQQCERCVFTTINTTSLQKDPNGEPLKTLSQYRIGPLGGIVFGIHAVPVTVDNHAIHVKDNIGVQSKVRREVQVRT